VPDWLAIAIAVAAPLASFVGVVWSRAKTETRIVGRIDLMDQKLDATIAAHNVRFKAIEDKQSDAKQSRSKLYDADKDREARLRELATVCKLTHPERAQ
jgi:hypothetical protein